MKKLFYIMAVLILVFGVSCQRDSDVLVTMKDGEITRGEFKEWLKSKRIPVKNVMKRKKSQKDYLRRMALEKLGYEKYLKENSKENPDMKIFERVVKVNFIAGYYVNDLRKNLPFSEVCSDISLIKLPLFERAKAPKQGMVDKREESEKLFKDTIIPALKDGESFAKLAKKYSTDYTKKKGGNVGFITGKMMGPQIESIVAGLKTGEFTEKPFQMRNALFLLKVNKRKTLTRYNIKNRLTDKKTGNRIERYIVSETLRNYIQGLEKAKDIVSNLESAKFDSPQEVLFKVGDYSFTNGDFDDMLKVFYKLRFGHTKNINIDNRRKVAMAKRLLSERVLYRDALKNGVEKQGNFKKQWESVSKSSLSGAYKFLEISKQVAITKKDIRDEYRKNRETRYSRSKGKGKKKVAIPFEKVKESIEQNLFGKKLGTLRNKWDDDLLKNSDFKIVESELKEKKK